MPVTNMRVDLGGKVALVTGAGRGIGRAIALGLAENGADVVVADLPTTGGMGAAREVEALGRRAIFIETDVSDRVRAGHMVDRAVEAFGAIDILVNNAGVNVSPAGRKPIHEFAEGDWERVLGVDLDGVFHCSKPAVQQMIRQGRGKIINIGSVAGLVPLRLQCAYVAAKAAVLNLTRAMALELAPHNIHVNAIAPGSILTELTREAFYHDPAKTQALVSHIPLKRPGDPEDIANAALFLASEASNYMTGSIIVVDGGWTCGYNRDW